MNHSLHDSNLPCTDYQYSSLEVFVYKDSTTVLFDDMTWKGLPVKVVFERKAMVHSLQIFLNISTQEKAR